MTSTCVLRNGNNGSKDERALVEATSGLGLEVIKFPFEVAPIKRGAGSGQCILKMSTKKQNPHPFHSSGNEPSTSSPRNLFDFEIAIQ